MNSIMNSYTHHLDGEETWIEKETKGCCFKDIRLGKRFKKILKQLSCGIGESLPFACQDWANTKAAYRFMSNDQVSEKEILAGHFKATRDRFTGTKGFVLILQDTTEFCYHRKKPEDIGFTTITYTRGPKTPRPNFHTVCGLLMHSSLAVTTDGLPLGLAAIKFWTRKKFKGTNALKKKINPTRLPIEEKESIRWLENLKDSTHLFNDPDRCVHIGDRESDIYELFHTAQQEGTHFLIRTCVNRLAIDGKSTVKKEMETVQIKGFHTLCVRNKKGEEREAKLAIKYQKMLIYPPIGKNKKYSELSLTVIHAEEVSPPNTNDCIQWKLITDLPINTPQEAIEKLDWYSMRWKIETFHKILKSGCQAESLKLRTAERLINLIAIFCILSWRVFWMTMMNRLCPSMPAKVAFTDAEIQLLDLLTNDQKKISTTTQKVLSHYLIKIAKLGGYLGRAQDHPPGNCVIWKGISRLADIQYGFNIVHKLVGN